ncbi:4'-phosphopantetheinyl transferase superfamily protein, partial [Streptomyces sp. 4503]
LLRTVLARRLALPPARVPLVARCPGCGAAGHGPVRLADAVDGAAGWTLSIAHSGILVAVAVGHRTGAPGVDVETAERAKDIEALAPRLLGPGHRERLALLPAPAKRAALLRIWTGAESYAKATGTGLGHALARVRTTVGAEGQVCVDAPDEPADWSVRAVQAHAPATRRPSRPGTAPAYSSTRAADRAPALLSVDGPGEGQPMNPMDRPTASVRRGTRRGRRMRHTDDNPATPADGAPAAPDDALEILVRARLAERVGTALSRDIGREEAFHDLGIDSLDIVTVLADLERECDVERITDGELWDIADSVGALVRHLSAHGRLPGEAL